MSAPRATDDVLVHRDFGDATLARMRRQHEQQLAAQVGAANHLVFQERAPGGLHPAAVFEEFEHLEALYFGGGANQQRARLSVALASSMKASLLGEDSTTRDLQDRIESHHRKIDLELTKAQLRAEAEEHPV